MLEIIHFLTISKSLWKKIESVILSLQTKFPSDARHKLHFPLLTSFLFANLQNSKIVHKMSCQISYVLTYNDNFPIQLLHSTLGTKQRFFANKENFCKEKGAKKNIPGNLPFLGNFALKITIFWTFPHENYFFKIFHPNTLD